MTRLRRFRYLCTRPRCHHVSIARIGPNTKAHWRTWRRCGRCGKRTLHVALCYRPITGRALWDEPREATGL